MVGMKHKIKIYSAIFYVTILSVVIMCSCDTSENFEKQNNESLDTISKEEIVTSESELSDNNSFIDKLEYNDMNDFESNKRMYTVCCAEVRKSPSEEAEIYGVLDIGAEVNVLSLENNWYTVKFDNELFYINADCLSCQKSEGMDYNDISSRSDTGNKNSGMESDKKSKIIVIDAGHQRVCDLSEEPIGPGSDELKAKVTAGTRGTASGLNEYELTLQLALKLQCVLEDRGYKVIQVRTENDVNISNIERAEVANSANADAFIRIHANGSEDSSVNGAMTLCQTANNIYNGEIYRECKFLSESVLDELTAETGCKKQYVWETDTMCGINWSKVPVTIVEVGYMTNLQEDLLMATDGYQDKICIGIANGIDKYFEQN